MIILIFHIIVSFDRNILLIFYVKDGSHVRLWHPSCVYINAQRDSTLQYKRYVHLWNNFPCIITLSLGSIWVNWLSGCVYIHLRNFSTLYLFGTDTLTWGFRPLGSCYIILSKAVCLHSHYTCKQSYGSYWYILWF